MPVAGELVDAQLLPAGDYVAVRMVNRLGRRVPFVLPDRIVQVDGNTTAAVVVPMVDGFVVKRGDSGAIVAELSTDGVQ